MIEAPSEIFDRELYVWRLARARRSGANFLATTIAEELHERLALVSRSFERVCLIAPAPEPIAAKLSATGKMGNVVCRVPQAADDIGLEPEGFDALFNILDLHAVNDVPGALVQFRRALKPDGLFMACMFAGGTLTELRQSWLAAELQLMGGASPRVAPMIDIRELGALLQRTGFALPVADLDRTLVRYADAVALMHEIRALGFSNTLRARSRSPVSKRLLGTAASIYGTCFSDADGRVRVTVELAWATAWKPHESQQQPLKPGSAKMRLADALRVPERKL